MKKSISSMTDEEKRIAIAEECGAKWYLFDSGYTWLSLTDLEAKHCNRDGGWKAVDGPADMQKFTISDSVPDYLNDLNACAEMEDVGINSAKLEEAYCLALKHNFRATAPQRSEAFLLTKGWQP